MASQIPNLFSNSYFVVSCCALVQKELQDLKFKILETLKDNMSKVKDVNNHINGYNAAKHSIYTQVEYYLGFFNECNLYSGKSQKIVNPNLLIWFKKLIF